MNPEHTYGNRWWLNGCPKCRGAMHLCIDQDGQYRKCINCGKTEQATVDHTAVPLPQPAAT